jgi:hypothetical protein
MIEKQFEALRQMEAFTEDMFNRIIAFQEKQHPAWNSSLSFEERIKGLPLHYLMFSNADRDPARFGPTITNYYPLRQEIQMLAYYIQQTGDNAQVCDLYCGNGFIGSLLARELPQGTPVSGLHAYNAKPNQIESFYDSNCYQFSDAHLEDCECDVVFCSWIPSGTNPTPTIISKQPNLIIYGYTEHKNPETGERQSGTDDMFDALNQQYRLIDEWSVTRPENLFHEIWPDLTPNIEETRYTRVYAHQQFPDIQPPQALPEATPYDWENELAMAQLALKAKKEIQARGIPV